MSVKEAKISVKMDTGKRALQLDNVVIRFSGDSGDGMQLSGSLFSDSSALLGNGVSTFPDYPAEILSLIHISEPTRQYS